MLQNPTTHRSVVPRRGLARGAALAAALAAACALVVALGPRPRVADGWTEVTPGPDLDAWLAAREAGVLGIRAGEAKAVLWADSAARGRTAFALVYLHGFSADRHEVEPLVSDLARDLGANAFFARLAGHGQDGEALAEASVQAWMGDAAEALVIGERLGERVVLVGTSTGATLALWAAARPEVADRIAALVLISPNLGLRDRSSRVLLWPWGGLIARLVVGGERCFEPENDAQALHWTNCYPTRALLPMAALVAHVRSLDLGRVRAPTMVVYSRQDAVVDPAETERALEALGGGAPTYVLVEDSGDPAQHLIAGEIMSPETTDRVRERILEFVRGVAAR
jgi:esterase/lipase